MISNKNIAILKEIINKACKNKDYNKLKYIGQSLDCILFSSNSTEELYTLFKDIDFFLETKFINMLSKLDDTVYEDLNRIGIYRCRTFDLPYKEKQWNQ